MSLSSLLGRASVRAAVERVLDEVDESLVHELRKKDDEWHRKYDALQTNADDMQQRLASTEAANLRLEDDSRSLRQKISELTITVAQMTAEKEVALGSAAPNDPSVALKQSLEAALARYESAKKNRDALVDVARRRKTEVKQWIDYAESLERKVKRLEKKAAEKANKAAAPSTDSSTAGTSSKLANAVGIPVLADVQKPSLSTSPHSSFSASFLDSLGGDPELPSRSSNAAVAATRAGIHEEATLNSTQSDPSLDEPSPLQEPELPTPRAVRAEQRDHGHSGGRVKQEPLSDGPEIVWERPVKRQRRDEPRSQHQAIAAATRVKNEPAESSTAVAAAAGWPASSIIRESQESLDLDEGQLAMPTPRKRQLVFHDIPSQDDAESPASSQLTTQDRVAESPARNGVRGTPLATLSVNVSRVPCTGTELSKKGPTENAKQRKRGAETLLESGQPRTQQQVSEAVQSLNASSRLWSMLHKTPRENTSLSRTPRGQGGSEGESRARAATGTPGVSKGPGRSVAVASVAALAVTPRQAATAVSTPRTSTSLAAKDTATSAAKKAPLLLRERPIDQLTLRDFKINPARNDGAAFAYNEVVRSRGDRETLAGCTDPQCCGKVFRAMASSELAATPAAKGSRAGSPGAAAAVATFINRPDSIVTMEKYLGDEAYVLARMAPAEKQELWLEARTHELANKYGKHRHRFHRRASPPGFWDADFPTSQEEERYRVESAKQEKAVLLERHREAMRPGRAGRWLFRDE